MDERSAPKHVAPRVGGAAPSAAQVGHAAFVDGWLQSASHGLTHAEHITLLERALAALWARALMPLGEITVTAIFERVIHVATERYAFLSTLEIEPTGIRFEAYSRALDDERRLREALRFVLVEVLTVMGNLTADIITPALRAALARVAVREQSGADAEEGR